MNNNAVNNAVVFNRFEIMKYLVENGADVSERMIKNLEFAVENNNLEMVKYLFDKGNINDTTTNMLLKISSLNLKPEITKYALDCGADINYSHTIALRQYAKHGYLEIVKYLVKMVHK